ncbi:MAG: glutamate--tRNA ligase [Campylobacteraceae bacterium 4484_166]|nr:MAG: glutamate--tRNA ligase [Campylobacteraceae bacterium 4484_166]
MLRFAPSPTGDMHIGNLRVALLNFILSKQLNEKLIVRIEDTDSQRNIKDKEKDILNILDLFAIDYVQVLFQSDNLKFHTKLGLDLLLDKKAFNCFCSSEAIEKDRQKAKQSKKPYRYGDFCLNISDEAKLQCNAPFAVRIKRPQKSIKFKDMIKGEFSFEPFDVDSFIILREDKTPTYNFACAIDDMISDISYVIRGEDHLSNTPKQIHIRDMLDYKKSINYIHLPMILDITTGKKMSKRDETSSVQNLLKLGYLPVSIANYLVLLGYNPPKEIFTIEEAISWFDISKISKSPAKFDIKKLGYINSMHIKDMDDMRLSKIIGYADSDIGKLAKLYLEECDTTQQIKSKIDMIFSSNKKDETLGQNLTIVQNIIKKAPYFEEFEEFKKYIQNESKLKGKEFFKTLRFVITGAHSGPNLSEIYPLIKKFIGEIV